MYSFSFVVIRRRGEEKKHKTEGEFLPCDTISFSFLHFRGVGEGTLVWKGKNNVFFTMSAESRISDMQDINIRIIRNDMSGEERQKNKIMIETESLDYLIMNSPPHRPISRSFIVCLRLSRLKFMGIDEKAREGSSRRLGYSRQRHCQFPIPRDE